MDTQGMDSNAPAREYNQQLFSGGFRSKLHFARFHWVADQLRRLPRPAQSMMEIGCFDGKLLNFLDQRPPRYEGFDANWGNGLDIARERWAGTPGVRFTEADSPAALDLSEDDVFDVVVSMETLEHLTAEMVNDYLITIANHLDGYLLVTVPNEKGLFFLSKYCTKKLMRIGTERYTPGEIVNVTLGRMHKIDRTKHVGDHKGFDYHWLIGEISRYFDIQRVRGLPFGFLPVSFNYGVAILAKSRPRASAR